MELEPRAAIRVAKGTMIKVGLCLQKIVSFTFVGGTAASKDITLDFPVKAVLPKKQDESCTTVTKRGAAKSRQQSRHSTEVLGVLENFKRGIYFGVLVKEEREGGGGQ